MSGTAGEPLRFTGSKPCGPSRNSISHTADPAGRWRGIPGAAGGARGGSFGEAKAAIGRAVDTIAAREDDGVFRREGVEVLHGRATFRSPGEVDVDGAVIRSRRIVLATGAVPAVPPIDGLADVGYLTNENIFDLDELPASLAVLGGGAVGCELAQAYRRLGAPRGSDRESPPVTAGSRRMIDPIRDHPEGRPSSEARMGAPTASRCLVGALLCAGMVLAAVTLEVVGGHSANSPHPAWAARVVPLAWPAPVRVLWWMGIAAAAGGYRVLLGRAGFPQQRAVTVLFVVPFLLFAAAIARGAPWATWH